MCKEGKLDTYSKQFGHYDLYVSEEHKYVACLPQKSGCTTWKTILANNTEPLPLPNDDKAEHLHGNGMVRYGIKRLNNYNEEEKHKILSQYYKFMVIRHPLDRLLSSYSDKIVLGNFPHTRVGVLKLEHERYNTSHGDLSAFLEYILQEGNDDTHWHPASYLCDVCNVQYDRIVKLESQEQDLLDIIPHLGPYNRLSDAHANHKGAGAAKDFSRNIPDYANVSKALLDEVLDAGFGYDLKLFGYSWSNVFTVSGVLVTCAYPAMQCC
jgi:chondroitin 4-sulfotransferase 11